MYNADSFNEVVAKFMKGLNLDKESKPIRATIGEIVNTQIDQLVVTWMTPVQKKPQKIDDQFGCLIFLGR